MKFAICNEVFEGWEFDRVCSFARSVGYQGIELAPFTLSDRIENLSAATRKQMRATAAANDVQLIGLHWLLAKTEGLHLTSRDPAVRKATSDYLVELAQACHDLGGDIMVFGSPHQRNLTGSVSLDQGYEFAREVFATAMPPLSELGVYLCLEPLAPTETNFLQNCADALRLIKMVDHPNFLLHQDVKAMSSESKPVPEVIREFAAYTKHFHANDENLRGPGFGDVDFVPIFQALGETGYNGWVSVEVFDYAPDPETIARESIEYMKGCCR